MPKRKRKPEGENTRARQAWANRYAGQAYLYGIQNSGYRPITNTGNSVSVLDYVRPGFLIGLTPEGIIRGANTPTYLHQDETMGYFRSNSSGGLGTIYIPQSTNTAVAEHELGHAFQSASPGGMGSGRALGGMLGTRMRTGLETAYGEGFTPEEYYPMLGAYYGWNAESMPQEISEYYRRWFGRRLR